MGDRWYAFSLVGEEVFVGSVSQDEINQAASDQTEIEKLIVGPMDLAHDAVEVA